MFDLSWLSVKKLRLELAFSTLFPDRINTSSQARLAKTCEKTTANESYDNLYAVLADLEIEPGASTACNIQNNEEVSKAPSKPELDDSHPPSNVTFEDDPLESSYLIFKTLIVSG